MDKEQGAGLIKEIAASGILSREEVVSIYDSAAPAHPSVPERSSRISEVMYYIGSAIVFLGIAILIGQNWGDLSTGLRIISTLGAAVAAYISGCLFMLREHTRKVGIAFHLIAALVFPVGIAVAFHEMGMEPSSLGVQSVISGILLVVYLASLIAFRETLFVIFSVIFGTWFYFVLTQNMLEASMFWSAGHSLEYRVLAAGAAFLLMGYSFSKGRYAELTGSMYSLGVIGTLGAAFALGYRDTAMGMAWELFFPVLVFGAMFLGAHIKSRPFLVFGAMFLMAYILKITTRYFMDSMGWPMALVLAGLALIGVGYFTLYLKRRYIA